MFAVLPLFCLFTSKAYHAYTTGTLGTAQETIPNTYGDSNWKDKLTSYNGRTFTYDAIGNPLNDGVWNYEWEAGRKLKSMNPEGTALTFMYDHNGLRTQKIVQQDWYPVTTNYTLHGKLMSYITLCRKLTKSLKKKLMKNGCITCMSAFQTYY